MEVKEPTKGEKFAYDFDVWYSSSGNAEVVMLAFVNAFFLLVLFVLFAVTGSGSGLTGFEVSIR